MNVRGSLNRHRQSGGRDNFLPVGLVVFGAMAVGMSLTGEFLLYLVQMFVYGIVMTMVQTSITTMLQEKTELSMQGRVFGLMSSAYSGFMPLGMLVFGAMADKIPLQWIMAGGRRGAGDDGSESCVFRERRMKSNSSARAIRKNALTCLLRLAPLFSSYTGFSAHLNISRRILMRA